MAQTTLHNNQPVRLITIPVSHYCEKIRWALTRLQIPFVEERHMPPFHLLATQPVGGRSVPVLITAANTFTDSADILKYLDSIAPDNLKLYPHNPEERRQVEELVESFDAVLAPAVRQWFYFYAFSPSSSNHCGVKVFLGMNSSFSQLYFNGCDRLFSRCIQSMLNQQKYLTKAFVRYLRLSRIYWLMEELIW
jgi:glutathione S-transferase